MPLAVDVARSPLGASETGPSVPSAVVGMRSLSVAAKGRYLRPLSVVPVRPSFVVIAVGEVAPDVAPADVVRARSEMHSGHLRAEVAVSTPSTSCRGI